MATNIKALLNKKGWTGEEVGRLMIADLVTAYKNALQGADKGLLSDNDKAKLVNGLERKEDIRAYNEFKYIHDFVVTVPMRYALAQSTAEAAFWKLFHLLDKVRGVERDHQLSNFEPRIVSLSEYQKMKKTDFDEKMTLTISVEFLVITAIKYFFNLYKDGKRTPLNKYFTAAKKKLITNPRIKDNYWEAGNNGYYIYPDGTTSKDRSTEAKIRLFEKRQQEQNDIAAPFHITGATSVEQIVTSIRKQKEYENNSFSTGEWVEEPQAPETATMYDVLECVSGFYYSGETGNSLSFFELEQDLPEIYNAIWVYLTKIEALAFICNVSKEDIVSDKKRISYRLLYDNNILDYRAVVDNFIPNYGMSVAILQENSLTNSDIDENGNYKKKENYKFESYRAENLISEYSERIIECMNVIKKRYKEMYALHTFLAIAGEFSNVDGLEILLSPINEDMIEALNESFNLWEDIACADGRDCDQLDDLIKEIKNLLKPIPISSLQPTEEAIYSAKANMSFKTFQGYAADFINNYLMSEGEAE